MDRSPYLAITVFEFTSDAPGHMPLYREDMTLLYAESEAQARRLAEKNARSDEGIYRSVFLPFAGTPSSLRRVCAAQLFARWTCCTCGRDRPVIHPETDCGAA